MNIYIYIYISKLYSIVSRHHCFKIRPLNWERALIWSSKKLQNLSNPIKINHPKSIKNLVKLGTEAKTGSLTLPIFKTMQIIHSYIIGFKQTQPRYTKPTTKYEYIIAQIVIGSSSFQVEKKNEIYIYIYILKLCNIVSRHHCFKNRT